MLRNFDVKANFYDLIKKSINTRARAFFEEED
jgi:hypothetical protein